MHTQQLISTFLCLSISLFASSFTFPTPKSVPVSPFPVRPKRNQRRRLRQHTQQRQQKQQLRFVEIFILRSQQKRNFYDENEYYNYRYDDEGSDILYDDALTGRNTRMNSNRNDGYENRPFEQSRPIIDTASPVLPLVPQQRSGRSDIESYKDQHQDMVDDYEYDDDEDINDDDEATADDLESTMSKQPLPGNFWMNPINGEHQEQQQQRMRRHRTSRRQTQQQQFATSERRRRTTPSSKSFSGSIGNAQPSPPSPLLDLYQRLFWYGLNEDDFNADSSNDNRRSVTPSSGTMFGGTKGKFNGLSFLYDSIGAVPLNEQRPKRESSRRSSERTEEDVYDDTYNSNYYYDDSSNNRRFGNPGATSGNGMQSQRKPPFGKKYIPVTPPYDPPQVPPTRNKSRIDYERSDTPTTRSSTRARQIESKPNQRINNNDWVFRTVDSWFPTSGSNSNNNNDDEYISDQSSNDYNFISPTRTSRRQQRSGFNRNDIKDESYGESDRNRFVAPSGPASNIIQPLTNMLDTFLGLDRDKLQSEAGRYNEKMGLADPTPLSTSTRTNAYSRSTTSQSQRRGGTYHEEDHENAIYEINRFKRQNPNKPSIDVDSEQQQQMQELSSVENSSTVNVDSSIGHENYVLIDEGPEIQQKPTVDDTLPDVELHQLSNDINDNVTPLSWEERAAAIERVPPIGVTAWGVDGIIDDCDARTKAFQDAILDVQLVKEQINVQQQQILSLRDDMSVIHMDIELSKRQLQKMKRRQHELGDRQRQVEGVGPSLKKLIEQIRRMENELNSISCEVRYKELQKQRMTMEYNIIIKRRHWAIFHTVKYIITDESILSKRINDAFNELEINEPAVRRSKNKNMESQP